LGFVDFFEGEQEAALGEQEGAGGAFAGVGGMRTRIIGAPFAEELCIQQVHAAAG
jgi:hypothetical protein